MGSVHCRGAVGACSHWFACRQAGCHAQSHERVRPGLICMIGMLCMRVLHCRPSDCIACCDVYVATLLGRLGRGLAVSLCFGSGATSKDGLPSKYLAWLLVESWLSVHAKGVECQFRPLWYRHNVIRQETAQIIIWPEAVSEGSRGSCRYPGRCVIWTCFCHLQCKKSSIPCTQVIVGSVTVYWTLQV